MNQIPNFSIQDFEIEYKKRFLFYKPTKKQLAFHNAGFNAIERSVKGGNRSGKTFCGTIETAMHVTGFYPTNWKGHRFKDAITTWVASVDHVMTRDNLQKKLLGQFDKKRNFAGGLIQPSLIVKKVMLSGISDAVDYVQVKHSSGGLSTLFFKAFKQGKEKFQSERCDLIYLDEEPTYDVYTECLARLVDNDGRGQGRLILTMTPLKGYTEMVAHFLQHQSKDKRTETTDSEKLVQEEEIIKTDPDIVTDGKFHTYVSWDDNPYLTEESKNHLRKSLKPHELEAREKGIPCIGSGLVYQIPEFTFLTDPFEIPKHWSCVFGMDVGFGDPTAVVFLAHDRENDTVYVYKEYSVNGLTAAQHCGSLFMMGCNWMRGICDPAVNQRSQRDGARLLEDYGKVGLRIDKGKYTRELSIDAVLERIRTDRFKVFNNCRKFMDEWRNYSRNNQGQVIKGRDHLMNALEFVILDGLRLAKTNQEMTNRSQYRTTPRKLF